MTKTLDCEFFESALASLAQIYGVNANTITGYLKSIQYSEDVPIHMPWDDYLFQEFERTIGTQRACDEVIWFHLTRCKPGTTFENGILPLNLALPRITAELYDMEERALAAGLRLPSPTIPFEDSGYLYRHKTSHQILWGPYAMLVKEIAFVPKDAGQHDYLGIPEIIQDICGMESHRVNLREIFIKETKPCIVKFVSDEFNPSYLNAAVNYVHAKVNGNKLSWQTNTCFNAKGSTIPHSRILSVEFLKTPDAV